jgi:hypothetical protein
MSSLPKPDEDNISEIANKISNDYLSIEWISSELPTIETQPLIDYLSQQKTKGNQCFAKLLMEQDAIFKPFLDVNYIYSTKPHQSVIINGTYYLYQAAQKINRFPYEFLLFLDRLYRSTTKFDASKHVIDRYENFQAFVDAARDVLNDSSQRDGSYYCKGVGPFSEFAGNKSNPRFGETELQFLFDIWREFFRCAETKFSTLRVEIISKNAVCDNCSINLLQVGISMIFNVAVDSVNVYARVSSNSDTSRTGEYSLWNYPDIPFGNGWRHLKLVKLSRNLNPY